MAKKPKIFEPYTEFLPISIVKKSLPPLIPIDDKDKKNENKVITINITTEDEDQNGEKKGTQIEVINLDGDENEVITLDDESDEENRPPKLNQNPATHFKPKGMDDISDDSSQSNDDNTIENIHDSENTDDNEDLDENEFNELTDFFTA